MIYQGFASGVRDRLDHSVSCGDNQVRLTPNATSSATETTRRIAFCCFFLTLRQPTARTKSATWPSQYVSRTGRAWVNGVTMRRAASSHRLRGGRRCQHVGGRGAYKYSGRFHRNKGSRQGFFLLDGYPASCHGVGRGATEPTSACTASPGPCSRGWKRARWTRHGCESGGRPSPERLTTRSS